MALPDDVEVWPGHLGGSACGSSGIDHKSTSTIGFEREHNRALRFATEDEFVEDAIATLGAPPPNVEQIVAFNQGPLIEDMGTPVPLAPRAVEVGIAEGALLVDARTNEQFDEAHIPGAISASAYETGFATKVARVVPADVELIVVAASDGYELEAAELLASVGLRVRGYLEGGMTAWRSEGRPVRRIELIDPEELAGRLEENDIVVLDVRDDGRVRRRPHPRARSTSPTASCRTARASCRATGRSPRSAAAASAAASLPRSSSARGSSGSCTSPTAASAPGAAAGARSNRLA